MLILGAKGFAKELIEAILNCNLQYNDLVFYDDVNPKTDDLFLGKYNILRSLEEAKEYFEKGDKRFAIGIGTPVYRKQLSEKLEAIGGINTTVVSKHSIIGSFNNIIGEGSCVLAQVIVENDNSIGMGSLLHVGSFISHDVEIGNYCEISPYAKLLGGVKIGNLVSIGTGAIILPGISIGDNAVIGAGSVVTKSVNVGETIVGVPGKLINK